MQLKSQEMRKLHRSLIRCVLEQDGQKEDLGKSPGYG